MYDELKYKKYLVTLKNILSVARKCHYQHEFTVWNTWLKMCRFLKPGNRKKLMTWLFILLGII